MTSWGEFTAAQPRLAALVAERFAVRKHATMATLRKDGSPRISGTEVEFAGGELRLGSMPGALKALDLRRDGRLALHSPTVDAPPGDESAWPGEAKIAGRARELPAEEPGGAHVFAVDITEVVLTRIAESREELEITSWHPGRGEQTRLRR